MENTPQKYDPTDVDALKGIGFFTHSQHLYCIDLDGKIRGRQSMEGADVQFIAGIDDKYYVPIVMSLMDKEDLDDAIRKVGEKPRPGLHLVISLTPEAAKATGRNGLITSRIEPDGIKTLD